MDPYHIFETGESRGNLNLVFILIVATTSIDTAEYPGKGRVYGHVICLNFDK